MAPIACQFLVPAEALVFKQGFLGCPIMRLCLKEICWAQLERKSKKHSMKCISTARLSSPVLPGLVNKGNF